MNPMVKMQKEILCHLNGIRKQKHLQKESRRDRERKEENGSKTATLYKMNPFSSLGAVRLVEQQSCSADPKKTLTNCQSSIMELLMDNLAWSIYYIPLRCWSRTYQILFTREIARCSICSRHRVTPRF